MCTCESFEAAARPLNMAPSTFGATQKSPQTTNRLLSNHRHLSSFALNVVGNSLPLQSKYEIRKARLIYLKLISLWLKY